jgi:hypothetical protein
LEETWSIEVTDKTLPFGKKQIEEIVRTRPTPFHI